MVPVGFFRSSSWERISQATGNLELASVASSDLTASQSFTGRVRPAAEMISRREEIMKLDSVRAAVIPTPGPDFPFLPVTIVTGKTEPADSGLDSSPRLRWS